MGGNEASFRKNKVLCLRQHQSLNLPSTVRKYIYHRATEIK